MGRERQIIPWSERGFAELRKFEAGHVARRARDREAPSHHREPPRRHLLPAKLGERGIEGLAGARIRGHVPDRHVHEPLAPPVRPPSITRSSRWRFSTAMKGRNASRPG